MAGFARIIIFTGPNSLRVRPGSPESQFLQVWVRSGFGRVRQNPNFYRSASGQVRQNPNFCRSGFAWVRQNPTFYRSGFALVSPRFARLSFFPGPESAGFARIPIFTGLGFLWFRPGSPDSHLSQVRVRSMFGQVRQNPNFYRYGFGQVRQNPNFAGPGSAGFARIPMFTGPVSVRFARILIFAGNFKLPFFCFPTGILNFGFFPTGNLKLTVVSFVFLPRTGSVVFP